MSNISDWLSQIGLSQYAKSFVANDVTLELLPNLTADDLKDLGVTSVGHRRTLLRAIENLTQGDAAADATVVPETPRPTGPPTSEAERRRLTVLFCDLAGSTRLAGRLDPEIMRDVLVTYQNTVAGEIGRVEGHLAKFVGDGVLAYFGYPKAHEDDAERAIRAGIAIAKAVARLATPNKEALAVRIGIASGLVVVGETIGTGSALERSVVGETPNLAARLQSIAAPGQVVISAETRRLIADVFRLDDLGHLDLKGFDGKVRAFHVLGEGQAESRFEAHQTSDLGPMVGRDQELSLLLDRWRQAKAGEGQMVLLLGEAGIGKSRLTRGIIDAVASETHYRLLYQCSPFHTDSALYPVSQRLVRAARLAPDDSSEAALDKLEHALALGLDDVPPAAALLAPVLGLVSESRYGKSKLSPPQQRTRTLEVLASHLIGLSRRRPVLFVFEDAHWIDPTSLELLDFCLDRVATAPILMVVTARLTFEHRFGGHPIVTRLSLNRLGRDQARTIAERITAGRMLPGEVIQLIAARTDGVPLFVEELTKTIIESGALREVGGTLVLERPLTDIAVPASLHDSLMARLDRHPGLKEVAQFAACIGRDFGYPLLAAGCAMQESALCEALKLLASAELVFARGTPPDAAYVFKHALVRDAAYESLLKAQRRRIHARIADILEKQFPHLAANSPEVLAQHHSGAGHEDAAAHWWYVAGQRAIARSANKEALTSLTKALAILDLKPRGPNVQDIELDILIALASVATAVHGYASPVTEEIVMRARKAGRNSEDVNRTVSILYSVWSTYAGFADYEKCTEITVEMSEVSEKRAASRYRFLTSFMFGYEHQCLGQFILAEKHLQTSLDSYVRDEHYQFSFQLTEHAGELANSGMGLTHYFLGNHSRAMHSVDQAVRELKQSKHNNSLGLAMFYQSFLLMEYGLNEDAERVADELINFSMEQTLPQWVAAGVVVKGATVSRTADQRGGIELILKGIDDWRMTSNQFHIPQFYLYLAQAYLINHQFDEGLEAIRMAHEQADRTGEHWFTAELHRTEAELLLARRRDSMPVIEETLGRALEVARNQHSKTFELRAAMSLAKVWAERGEQSRARNLLEPVYGWFKEGTDTRDLIEARNLLDQLR